MPSKWYTVNASCKIITANTLVNPGPIIATMPVRPAPMRSTAAVVKNVGMTVQKIAIIKIITNAVLFTASAISIAGLVMAQYAKMPKLADMRAIQVNTWLPTLVINDLLIIK